LIANYIRLATPFGGPSILESWPIFNFYRFVELTELDTLRVSLEERGRELNLLGTILLASEGINANLAGPLDNLKVFVGEILCDKRFAGSQVKKTFGKTKPFRKLEVRIKPSIVTFSQQVPVTAIQGAQKITPEAFKELMAVNRDDVVVVDTRNDVEIEYGKFQQAETLGLRNFKEFLPRFAERYQDQRDKTFLIYCTGGIRCEKAAPALHELGFRNILQLDGGIINYFEKCGPDAYDGNCFVFDSRWSINPELHEAGITPPNKFVSA